MTAMEDAHSRPALAAYASRGVALVFLATAFTAALHHTWFVQRLELANLDALFVLSGSQPKNNITIVEISDEDYKKPEMFGGTSPLKPALVRQLIRAIDDGGARAIGVDIITTEWPANPAEKLQTRAPVVWIRDGEEVGGDLHVDQMGGNGTALCQGPPALEQVDGVVREYFPYFNNGTIPSFTTVLKQVAQDPRTTCQTPNTTYYKPGESRYIGFIKDDSAFDWFSAETLITLSQAQGWSTQQAMKDRIVLLGGAYKDSRDRYATPRGEMYGVRILANILASEMTNTTVKEAGLAVFIMADLLLGFALITVGCYLPRPWSLPVTLFGAPVIVVVLNILLFAGWRYYLSFMPVVVGVIVHSIMEHFHQHRHLLRQHTELEKRHAFLQLELEKLRGPKPTERARQRGDEI